MQHGPKNIGVQKLQFRSSQRIALGPNLHVLTANDHNLMLAARGRLKVCDDNRTLEIVLL